MYQLFARKNDFDQTPFQFARMTYLRDRVKENYNKLVETRRTQPGRLNSSHILSAILLNLGVNFNGDLMKYMADCDTAAKRLCGPLGITSSFSKGKLHLESFFYHGCPEIIVYARNPKWSVMDLWRGWDQVEPIQIVTHPITSTKVIELAVMNEAKLEHPGLAIICVDIPLLAAQWKMWQAANPHKLVEEFLLQVPLVGAMKSHLNVALFNKVQLDLGNIPECGVKGNLPFAQTPTEGHADNLIAEVMEKVLSKAMTANQVLDTIPAVFGTSYLREVQLPPMQPTFQCLWALISQKAAAAGVALKVGKASGYTRMLHDITIIRRMRIDNAQDKVLSNGLSTAAAILISGRVDDLVYANLPKLPGEEDQTA